MYRSYDSVKKEWFWRPLGGSIEFGEYSNEGARREMLEETGKAIEDVTLLSVVENIFECDGMPGHEIVFIYDAKFSDRSLYDLPVLHCYEHGNDRHFTALWKTVAEVEELGEPLYPESLAALLQNSGS